MTSEIIFFVYPADIGYVSALKDFATKVVLPSQMLE